MLNEAKKAMRSTAARLIGDLLEDSTTQEDPSNIPGHVARIRDSSWTYAIAPIQDTDDPNELENLHDRDCIAINFARDKWGILKSQLLYLDWFVVDVANMIATGVMPYGHMNYYKLVRSSCNDRRRSRLTMRKQFDASNFKWQKATPFFAKSVKEFANEWWRDHNGRKRATPRQVITGLARFYGLHAMQQLLKSRAGKVKKTYERVFDTIHLLLAFPDLDKQFHTDREDTGPSYHPDYDVWNPKSKVCFLVLWLYSVFL